MAPKTVQAHTSVNDNHVSHDGVADESVIKDRIRRASVYDVVAGRLGPNGFLTSEQLQSSNLLPSGPEEYLLRRTTIPAGLLNESVAVSDQTLSSSRNALPQADSFNAIHAYVSDFYYARGNDRAKLDYRSLDETALIAMGILLEEAVRESLGDNGDMVFVEPEGLEDGLEESKMTKHQIKGRVRPTRIPQSASEEDSIEEEASPAKRRRH